MPPVYKKESDNSLNWRPAGVETVIPVTGSGAIVLATSPALLTSPTAPTQGVTDNSTKLATTAYVTTAVANAVAAVVYAAAYSVANQSVNHGTVIKFDTSDFDSGSVYSTATGLFTVPAGCAGRYAVGCSVFVTSAVAVEQYELIPLLNGALNINGGLAILFGPGAGQNMGLNATTLVNLAAGDTISWTMYGSWTAPQTVLAAAAPNFYNPRGWIERLA